MKGINVITCSASHGLFLGFAEWVGDGITKTHSRVGLILLHSLFVVQNQSLSSSLASSWSVINEASKAAVYAFTSACFWGLRVCSRAMFFYICICPTGHQHVDMCFRSPAPIPLPGPPCSILMCDSQAAHKTEEMPCG